jgi:hypothetical protein
VASYPAFLPWKGSDEQWADPILVSRARSGGVRARRLATEKKKVFKLVHGGLTTADKATFETFYDTNRALTFVFTWSGDGNDYTCIFGAEIKWTPTNTFTWNAEVLLLEV